MRRVFCFLFLLMVITGCKSRSAPAYSFVVTLQNGRSYRITPDEQKLQQGSNLVFSMGSEQPLTEQFKEKVTERVALQEKRETDLNIGKLVFGEARIRLASGACAPPLEFRVEDYAIVEELSK